MNAVASRGASRLDPQTPSPPPTILTSAPPDERHVAELIINFVAIFSYHINPADMTKSIGIRLSPSRYEADSVTCLDLIKQPIISKH